ARASRLCDRWMPSIRDEATLSERNRFWASAPRVATRGGESFRCWRALAASARAATAAPASAKSRSPIFSGRKTSYVAARLAFRPPYAPGSAGQSRFSSRPSGAIADGVGVADVVSRTFQSCARIVRIDSVAYKAAVGL